MNLAEAKIHFIGIGGIGMSGIAEVLVNMGCRVSGSDLAVNAQVQRLRALGVDISHGHRAQNIPKNCDVVVFSSAVNEKNSEIIEANRRKIPVIQRAEMLSELMRLKRGIAIGGTHGKTTTTSMTASLMLEASLDPTIVVGGRLDLIKSTAALGKGQWLLAEADESDGSFLRLSPEVVVATNIDNDHMDYYRTFDALKNAFREFLQNVPFYGLAIVCADDQNLFEMTKKFSKRVMTYGFGSGARLRALNIKPAETTQTFDVELDKKSLGPRVTLQVPGQHNVLNSLAAIAVGLELKIEFETISKGLASFRGVDRRLQMYGEFEGVLVFDDYGHHPTEVQATLSALKNAYPSRRLVVAFQPHRYSRTQVCWDQFQKSFSLADVVGIVEIYSAGEKPIEGVNSEKLSQAVSENHAYAFFLGRLDLAYKKIRTVLKPGDLFLTLGAGDVWKIAAQFSANKI